MAPDSSAAGLYLSEYCCSTFNRDRSDRCFWNSNRDERLPKPGSSRKRLLDTFRYGVALALANNEGF
jgi:hypothetical protein